MNHTDNGATSSRGGGTSYEHDEQRKSQDGAARRANEVWSLRDELACLVLTGEVSGGGIGLLDAAPAALDIITEFAPAFHSPDAVARLERFAAQAFARVLLPANRVGMCLRLQVEGRAGVWASPSKASARLSGVAVCGLAWVCPVCAAKISERRRVELEEALQAWRRIDGSVLMATLTFAHVRTDKLSDILARVVAAYRDMTRHRPYMRLKASYGLKYTVRATEITWGNAYGWHPHFHVLLFLADEVDRAALETELYLCWSSALAAHGLHVDRQFVNVRQTTDAADQYVAKWGRAWTAADELTKANTKRGRLNHYTPFDLLRLGATGVQWAAYRFEEYVKATKGKSQLQWSRGLRAALGLAEPVVDIEAAAAVEPDDILLALLEPHEFAAIKKYNQVGQLLEVARTLDAERVRVFVARLTRRYMEDKRFPSVQT